MLQEICEPILQCVPAAMVVSQAMSLTLAVFSHHPVVLIHDENSNIKAFCNLSTKYKKCTQITGSAAEEPSEGHLKILAFSPPNKRLWFSIGVGKYMPVAMEFDVP